MQAAASQLDILLPTQDLWSLSQQQAILAAATRLLLARQQQLQVPDSALQGLRAALVEACRSSPSAAARSAADAAPAQLLLWALDAAGQVRLLTWAGFADHFLRFGKQLRCNEINCANGR